MEKLPDDQTPSWLGLPNNAETVILQTKAKTFLQKLLKMQTVTEDEDLAYQEYVTAAFVFCFWGRVYRVQCTSCV